MVCKTVNGERVRLFELNAESAGTRTTISLRREFRSTPRENDREVRKWIGEGPSSQQVEDETVDERRTTGLPQCGQCGAFFKSQKRCDTHAEGCTKVTGHNGSFPAVLYRCLKTFFEERRTLSEQVARAS